MNCVARRVAPQAFGVPLSYDATLQVPSISEFPARNLGIMNYAALSRCTAGIIVAASLAACSSTPQREAQWVDAGLGSQSQLLRGARVLVACDVYDIALRRICEDQVSAELRMRGALPIPVPAGVALLNDRELDAQLLPSAGAAGAKALFVMQMTPATRGGGSGVSLGLGGFSFGGSGGVGVGLGLPIGGSDSGSMGFAASGRVTEVSGQRLVWTATFVAPPSADLDAQFKQLSSAVMDAARDAGLF